MLKIKNYLSVSSVQSINSSLKAGTCNYIKNETSTNNPKKDILEPDSSYQIYFM